MSYLDYYARTAAELATDTGDGLWIQGPKPANKLWLVSFLSTCHSGDDNDYQYQDRLQDALGKFLHKRLGYSTWTNVPEDGTIHRLVTVLARAGDSLIITRDDTWWIFEAENLKLHAVGELFAPTAQVLTRAIEQHLQTTIYANDNCPLD